jgi:putative transposase
VWWLRLGIQIERIKPGPGTEPSQRPYRGLPDIEYPFHERTVTVTQCGRICMGRKKVNLSQVFAGQNVGIRE